MSYIKTFIKLSYVRFPVICPFALTVGMMNVKCETGTFTGPGPWT